MAKHENEITKSVFIYKTIIFGTAKCMKCFQDVKGFLSDYLHEAYPFKLKWCFQMKGY